MRSSPMIGQRGLQSFRLDPPTMTDRTSTVDALIAAGAAELGAAGIEAARREARLLLAMASARSVEQLVAWPEHMVDPAHRRAFEALIARRARREPIAQILGCREFWSLPLLTTRDTLTPRPDSETVIEAALARIPDRSRSLRILDLGTGTGCLLLALLSELPNATGIGTDMSVAALHVARHNAETLGLAARAQFVAADWDFGLSGRFDLIVSNPPYIATDEIADLEPEVRDYEPRLALDGGPDGLAAYRTLAPRICTRLCPGGIAILEVGRGQADAVERILRAAGLDPKGRHHDLSGVERCVIADVNQGA